jgi:hypothetical protein
VLQNFGDVKPWKATAADEERYGRLQARYHEKSETLKRIWKLYHPEEQTIGESLRDRFAGQPPSKDEIIDCIRYFYPPRSTLKVHVLDFGLSGCKETIVDLCDIEGGKCLVADCKGKEVR